MRTYDKNRCAIRDYEPRSLLLRKSRDMEPGDGGKSSGAFRLDIPRGIPRVPGDPPGDVPGHGGQSERGVSEWSLSDVDDVHNIHDCELLGSDTI